MDAKQANILDRLNQACNQLLAAIEGLDAKTLSTEIIADDWTASTRDMSTSSAPTTTLTSGTRARRLA